MLEKYVFPYIRKWCVVGGLCLAFPWVAYAQQQKISLNIQNVTLKQAMEQIKEQAVVNVAYSKEFVDPNKTVSFANLGDKSPAEYFDTEPVARALTLGKEKDASVAPKAAAPAPAPTPAAQPAKGLDLDALLGDL